MYVPDDGVTPVICGAGECVGDTAGRTVSGVGGWKESLSCGRGCAAAGESGVL